MTDKNIADDSTEFSDAFRDLADTDQGQPDPGRPGGSEQGAGETGGADPAAGDGLPTGEPQHPAAEHRPTGQGEISDELAGLSAEELRARLKAERDRAAKAENAIRSNEGRWSRAQRELHELRLRQAALPQDDDPAEMPEPISEEELERLEDDYEDLQPLVATVRGLRSELEGLKAEGASRARIEAKQAEIDAREFVGRQYETLDSRHSDWRGIVMTEDYAAWAMAQPDWIQDLIRRNGGEQLVDGEGAAVVFDRFKADMAQAADPRRERRTLQLEGSRHVPGRSPAMEPRGRGGGDFDSEWAAAADEDRRRNAARR